MKIRKTLALGTLPWLLASGLVGCSSRGPTDGADAQIAFGVDMAKRGLWNEALFRFEQARRLGPSDARALNNLAVAYEAVGRFDEALEAYRQAVQADSNNRALRQNYSRFLEFYQAFRPKKPAAPAAESPAPAEGAPEPTSAPTAAGGVR